MALDTFKCDCLTALHFKGLTCPDNDSVTSQKQRDAVKATTSEAKVKDLEPKGKDTVSRPRGSSGPRNGTQPKLATCSEVTAI